MGCDAFDSSAREANPKEVREIIKIRWEAPHVY